MHEIVLPEAKPALEWVNNRILQKVSPRREHALAQGRFFSALDDWASRTGAGTAGTEWHFQIRPPGEIGRTMVPDVAFLSFDRFSYEEQAANPVPWVAPDVVVEVRSPDDAQEDIDEKVRVYSAAGTNVVFLVDPRAKIVAIKDVRGVEIVGEETVIQHESLPGFMLPVRRLFESPRPK